MSGMVDSGWWDLLRQKSLSAAMPGMLCFQCYLVTVVTMGSAMELHPLLSIIRLLPPDLESPAVSLPKIGGHTVMFEEILDIK